MEFKKLSKCNNFYEISDIFIPQSTGHNQIIIDDYIGELNKTRNTWLINLALSILLESGTLGLIYLKVNNEDRITCSVDHNKSLIFLDVPDKSFMNSTHDFATFHDQYGVIAKKLLEFQKR